MAKLESKPWVKTTIGSFVATVLGIVLTLGTSKLAEIKNNRAMQRQCVFNVLSDIGNAKKYFQKDSTEIAELGQWLTDYMDRDQEFPLDSALAKFYVTSYYPTYLRETCIPVGRSIMSAIIPANEEDMALHRTMELAYSYIDRIQVVSDEFHKLLDHMIEISTKIDFDPIGMNEKEAVEIYRNDDNVKLLTGFVSQVDGAKNYGSFLKNLQVYYDTILKMSGLTEEDYESYSENVYKSQGRKGILSNK